MHEESRPLLESSLLSGTGPAPLCEPADPVGVPAQVLWSQRGPSPWCCRRLPSQPVCTHMRAQTRRDAGAQSPARPPTVAFTLGARVRCSGKLWPPAGNVSTRGRAYYLASEEPELILLFFHETKRPWESCPNSLALHFLTSRVENQSHVRPTRGMFSEVLA